MNGRWTIYLRPRAFSTLDHALTISALDEVESLYLYEALERAGERVELRQERAEIVTVRTSHG